MKQSSAMKSYINKKQINQSAKKNSLNKTRKKKENVSSDSSAFHWGNKLNLFAPFL